jgi:hypothetical protein
MSHYYIFELRYAGRIGQTPYKGTDWEPAFVAETFEAGMRHLFDAYNDGHFVLTEGEMTPREANFTVFFVDDIADGDRFQVCARRSTFVRADPETRPRNFTVITWMCDDDASGVQFIGQRGSFAEAYALARSFDGYAEAEYPTPELDADEWQGWIGSTMYAIKAFSST